jgi:hypothetical protein
MTKLDIVRVAFTVEMSPVLEENFRKPGHSTASLGDSKVKIEVFSQGELLTIAPHREDVLASQHGRGMTNH